MLLNAVYQQVQRNGGASAVRRGELVLSYGQLWDTAARMASFLQKEGRGPVLVWGHKHPAMTASLLACLLCGRPWVPCDVSLPIQRLEKIAEQCGASLLLTTEEENALKIPGLNPLFWEEVLDEKGLPFREPDRENTAYIMFTSGTTGTPKGIPISVGNLDSFCRWLLSLPEIHALAGKVIINQANLSFDLSMADLCAALGQGGCLVLTTKEEQFQLGPFFQEIKQREGALLVCTPTFLRLCLCDRGFSGGNLPSLKAVFLCGEPFPASAARKMKERFPDAVLLNAYGPTEAACAVCAVAVDGTEGDPLPAGNINSAAVEIQIDDGEICLSGPSVFRGYLGGEPLDGPYHTGDLGAVKDGLLFCLGRQDSQIKYMGYRMELEEVRLALEALPGVEQAAVLAQRDSDRMVRRLTAYIAPFPADCAPLREGLLKKLPAYMVPGLFLPLEQLPTSQNTKAR